MNVIKMRMAPASSCHVFIRACFSLWLFLKYKSLQKIFLVRRANAIQQRLCDFS